MKAPWGQLTQPLRDYKEKFKRVKCQSMARHPDGASLVLGVCRVWRALPDLSPFSARRKRGAFQSRCPPPPIHSWPRQLDDRFGAGSAIKAVPHPAAAISHSFGRNGCLGRNGGQCQLETEGRINRMAGVQTKPPFKEADESWERSHFGGINFLRMRRTSSRKIQPSAWSLIRPIACMNA